MNLSVLRYRQKLQVFWSNAPDIIATMVPFFSLRRLTYKKMMNTNFLLYSWMPKRSVATSFLRRVSRPVPARLGLFHMQPKPFFNRHVSGPTGPNRSDGSVAPQALIMHKTDSTVNFVCRVCRSVAPAYLAYLNRVPQSRGPRLNRSSRRTLRAAILRIMVCGLKVRFTELTNEYNWFGRHGRMIPNGTRLVYLD